MKGVILTCVSEFLFPEVPKKVPKKCPQKFPKKCPEKFPKKCPEKSVQETVSHKSVPTKQGPQTSSLIIFVRFSMD